MKRWLAHVVVLAFGGQAGCMGAAVETSAAQAIRVVGVELRRSLAEYQRDLEMMDDFRESETIAAFAARSRQSADDEDQMSRHVENFQAALKQIQQDRAVNLHRYYLTLNNLQLLEEIADGLNQYGLQRTQVNENVQQQLWSWTSAAIAGKESS